MSAVPISLRRRVALAFTLLGFVLSLLFATAAIVITEDYEEILVNEILSGQAEDYSARLAAGLDAALPQTRRLSGYLAGTPNTPPQYAVLPPGIHEDEVNEEMHIGVFDTASGRLIFVVDLSGIEQLERHLERLLAAIIILGTGIAGWMGWILAGRALAPVGHLVEAVQALPDRPQRTALASTVSHDELGQLASAIDDYQARMVEADAREQGFFADASHELRTPIAVVQGVAEVLLDEPDHDPVVRQRLQRLDRGMQELTDLLDVLLGLARRSAMQVEDIDADELLREASAGILSTRPGLRVEIQASGSLRVPRRESLLLLRGMIRHATPLDDGRSLRLRLCAPWLEVEVGAVEAEHSVLRGSGPRRSDTGRALSLVERLASHMGWQLDWTEGRNVRARLPMAAFAEPR